MDPLTSGLLLGVGGLSSGLGAYFSYKGSKESAKAMKKAQEMQTNLQIAQLLRYQMLYGDIEKKVSDFFKNLSPETLREIGFGNIESQFKNAEKNINANLTQRGLTNSGAVQNAVSNIEIAKALAKASLQTQAPFTVANEKMKFLSLGRGIPQMVANNLSNIYGSQANYYAQQNMMYDRQFANALSGLGGLVGYALGAGIFGSDSNAGLQLIQNQPLTYTPTTSGYNFSLLGKDFKL